jgi:FkbM family methyltransferase
MYDSNYNWALPIISDLNIKINRVAEIGSRDALDGIFLAEFYSAKVDVFEPDPINIATCKKNISERQSIPNLTFHDFALSNKNETVNFLSIDPTKYDNPGAGGFYEIDFNNRPKSDPDYKRGSIQKTVPVEAKRFDSLAIETPDLIAMDVQGAELVVLEGFGEKLKNVKAVILETSFSKNYIGGSNFLEVNDFLQKNNFSYVASDCFKKKKPRPNLIRKLFNQWQREFNCLYVNNRK